MQSQAHSSQFAKAIIESGSSVGRNIRNRVKQNCFRGMVLSRILDHFKATPVVLICFRQQILNEVDTQRSARLIYRNISGVLADVIKSMKVEKNVLVYILFIYKLLSLKLSFPFHQFCLFLNSILQKKRKKKK